MGRNWTPAQHDAIYARGGSLLVSAAAGSGKTSVLVQRLLQRLTDPLHPVAADRLLVVTFTKAAAAEMKSRITREIGALLEQEPDNIHLQRQQILLNRAHISTIHSFCSELVRENFYKLGISPDFRILEENETLLLRQEVITAVLDGYYEKRDGLFYELADTFSVGRDDGRIAQMVQLLYDFTRSHPFPDRWLSETARSYSTAAPVEKTPWGKTVLNFAGQAVDYCCSLVKNSLELMEASPDIQAAYEEAYLSDLAGLMDIEKAIEAENWNLLVELCGDFFYKRLKSLKGAKEDPVRLAVAANRDEVKATLKRLGVLFCGTETACREDLRRLSPLVEKLFEVVRTYSARLDEEKAKKKAADFGDLEHWALRLLVKDTAQGPEWTPEALELSQRFEEVMVDEYQDTNEAQDMIFRALSRNSENLFLVGDVKQSIYGFRQAMPQLFLRRRRAYPLYQRDAEQYPACIVLDRNFRSAVGVTDAVNFVFRQLMSRETGDLDYSGDEELVPAADYPPGPAAMRLDILDLSAGEEEEMVAAEARHLAGMILELTAQESVLDGGEERPLAFSDITILLRSANEYAYQYVKELRAYGVPATADTAVGFFSAPEVAAVLAFLRVIDNPMQDIPLLSVLMGPVYGFTADDMARLRIHEKSKNIYLMLAGAVKEDERVAGVLKDIERLRMLAAAMTSDQLINELYERTGFPEVVQAMENGELRLANLRLLLDYARKYEASGYNGLSGFVRFLDRLERQKQDLSAAASEGTVNAVRIMSIHRSKGLEFPICIVAGCARRFNKDHGEVLLHPQLGFGCRLPDSETGGRITTLPHEAIALELDREEMSEELRVLYVAMTRAKQRLIMLTSVKGVDKVLARLASKLPRAERLQPYVVRGCGSISDWLILCALRHPSGSALRERAGMGERPPLPAKEAWEIRILRGEQTGAREEAQARQEPPASGLPEQDQDLLQSFERLFRYQYPYQELASLQAKVTASGLAEETEQESFEASSRPAFMEKGGLTPAEKGTALHAFLQFADFARAAGSPQEELERLVGGRFLTREQAGAVDLAKIEQFFASDLGTRLLHAKNVLREYRFTVELPAREAAPELSAEWADQKVVLQGAIDCAFEEDGAFVILDFKTDRVKSSQELRGRYEVQLSLYRRALQQCTNQKVKECLLYSFHLGESCKIE